MITHTAYDIQSDSGIDVTLYSNRTEFDISIHLNGWANTISLNKEQVSNLIVALVEMHKEML